MIVPNTTTERMARALNETLSIIFAYKHGFFNALSEKGELTEIEFSAITGIPERSISALVSLFVAQNPPLIEKTENERVRFAEEGKIYLDPKSDFHMGSLLDFISKSKDAFSPELFAQHMMTDQPSKPMFNVEPEFNRQVIAAMHAKSVGPASEWINAIDLSGYNHLLDIGGGSGVFSINAVKRWPNLKATVFELPHIKDITEEYTKTTSVAVETGDFWKDGYPEADVHFYSDIIHDWSYEENVELAKKSFDSLSKGGRIVLHEAPLNDDKTGPKHTAVYNFSVIRWTPGRQYSKSELIGFLEKAGFSEAECIPTGYLDWALITGVKK